MHPESLNEKGTEFRCHFCKYSTVDPERFLKHLATDHGESFTCTFCSEEMDSIFPKFYLLKNHVLEEHGEHNAALLKKPPNRFECEQCDYVGTTGVCSLILDTSSMH